MTETREKFIATTSRLMENQGYHATGLNQIIRESGAPKGSLYYHFPGGKEELAAEAVGQTAANFARLIDENISEGRPIHQALRDFIYGIARGVEATQFQSGGPLTAIAMETAATNEKLNLACRQAFTRIQSAIKQKLKAANFEEKEADRWSIFITSAIEGGIILSRTHHSGDPLRTVADQLYLFIKEQHD